MVSRPAKHKGFTLIELMVTIAIAAILLTIGVPSLTSFFDRQKVIAAAESAYSLLHEARVSAISKSKYIQITYSGSGSTNWKIGLREENPDFYFDDNTSTPSITECNTSVTDKSSPNACVFDADGDATTHSDRVFKLLKNIDNFQFDDVEMNVIYGDASDNFFDSTRGVFKHSQSSNDIESFKISFESPEGLKLNVYLKVVGKIFICSPDASVSGYRSCP